MRTYPLFEAFPALAALPRAGLMPEATPVVPLAGCARVWLKRDDLSAADYGGNKVRKLDLLLAAAAADGRRDLITFGYSGSNFVAATAWHGRKLGLRTHAFLLRQADAPYVADNLATALHAGATLRVGGSQPAVAAAAVRHTLALLARQRRAPRWIPPGGSSALGALGFVNAAFELRTQIDAGALPVPDRLYVAFSSMGTVAGLAIGLALAGLPTRIVAVQVVAPGMAGARGLETLIGRTQGLLRRFDPRAAAAVPAAVEIRSDCFGPAYAVGTPRTAAAMSRFSAASGARCDSAYSGKALEALYADVDRDRAGTALYWHTFNAHGRPAGVAPLAADAVRRFLR